ncbi:hypothetical protein CEQ90_05510 [Lewinellaceae bacterium SD302]|nr:hypothetical protein CEQ90_05510 [Lewinellaceae bacterium SD302]
MKNVLIIFALTLFTTTSCVAQWGNWKAIKGDGNIVTKDRDVSDFDEVKASASIAVYVTKGNKFSVQVETDENLQEHIRTEVSGDRLNVGVMDKSNINPSKRVKVYVTMPEIVALQSSSSSKLICKSAFTGKDLDLDVSSSGYIEVEFSGKYVETQGSSSGKIDLKGSADKFRFRGSSSSVVDAKEFVAKSVKARGSSSSRLYIQVTDEIDSDLSSSARVEYSGDPDRVYSDLSSGGKVRKVN